MLTCRHESHLPWRCHQESLGYLMKHGPAK